MLTPSKALSIAPIPTKTASRDLKETCGSQTDAVFISEMRWEHFLRLYPAIFKPFFVNFFISAQMPKIRHGFSLNTFFQRVFRKCLNIFHTHYFHIT